MIQAKDIFKAYGEVEVLKGISLQVSKAEIVSIVGASGAGKTTLLQILGTLENPNSGKLLYGDEDVTKLSKKELSKFRNQKIGFIFQFHHLLPEFTALENVCLPSFIAKKPTAESDKKAKELLDYLNLSHRIDHKPTELSGGEQQRVAVARSLINSPEVIFADEPSGNLDSKNAQELHELFFKLRQEFDQSFVIVTHNEELAEMADRKLTIADGRIEKSANT